MSQSPIPPDDILIVIPTLNEARTVAACIRAVAHRPDADIVVADGGSRDGTQQIVEGLRAEFPGLRLLNNPRRVQSAGINLAVKRCAEARHRVLIRCDAHALYPPAYAPRLAATLRRTGAASVVVPMDAVGETPFARAAARIVDTPLGSGGAAHRGGRVSGWVDHGHHAAFDLGWFRRIGGYDPGFSHNEDAEYDHRLGQAGGRIWLDSGNRITYLMRPTPGALAGQYAAYGRGRARMLARHRLPGRVRQVLPVAHFLVQCTGLMLAPVAPELLVLPGAYLGLCLSASLWCVFRSRDWSGLHAAPALIIMHNAWAFGFLCERLPGIPGRRSRSGTPP